MVIWKMKCLDKQCDNDDEMTKAYDDIARSENKDIKAKRSC